MLTEDVEIKMIQTKFVNQIHATLTAETACIGITV